MDHSALRLERARIILRWLLAAAYLFAGYVHVHSPHFFMPVMPAWVPYPRETIVGTGLCEIAGAIGLLIPRIRRFAAIMLSLYAVCVFPANIKHMLDFAHGSGSAIGWLYHGPRMLFQPVIVWWTLFSGGLIDWPFGSKSPSLEGRG